MLHFDKQNSLSFQSITQTMKIKKSKKEGLCFYHPDKQAKYRDRQSDLLYCKSCAIQQASKGALIEDFTIKIPQSSQNFSIINEVYEQCQGQIQEYIQNYNTKYQKLLESLTEMQIKDLLIFNKQFQQNHLTYQRLKASLYKKWSIQQIQRQFELNFDLNQQIISKINNLNQQINQYKCNRQNLQKPRLSLKSNARIRSQVKEHIDNKLFNQSSISLQEIHSRQSAQKSVRISQNNTNSLRSKNNSTLEQIKKSVYEDTPESVKLCMSDNNCIKVTNNMAVTMFQKIDVCESISLSNNSQTDLKAQLPKLAQNNSGRSSLCSQKSRYRYGTVNQP